MLKVSRKMLFELWYVVKNLLILRKIKCRIHSVSLLVVVATNTEKAGELEILPLNISIEKKEVSYVCSCSALCPFLQV